MRTTLTCLLVVVCLSAFAFSTELSYLPQVADGTWAGGSMKTTFILFNPTDTTVTVTFKLTDDAGGKLEVTIPGLGTDDEFGPITLEPGQTRFFQTSGTGGLRVGAAEVESSTRIGVSAIFSLFDTADHFITEAGVGSSLPGTNFVLPVDATGQFNTGVAIFVPGAAPAHIEFILTDADGSTVVGTTSQTVPAGGHMARFAAGAGSLFPQAGNLRGTLEISSDQPVATVVLRQNGAPLTNTTLPVVATDSTKTQFNFSQVANGTDQGLSIRTTFIVFNYSSGAANVNFVTRKPDGSAFPLTIPGGVANNTSTFSRQLASGGAVFLQTDGTGPISVGTAQITSDIPVGVAAIFTVFSGQTFLTEAGVGDATSRTDFTLPVDTTGSFNTGVAVFNPGDVPAQVTYRLLDENGVRVDQVTGLLLPGRSQSAKFVTEHFAGRTNFRGSLSVSSTVALAAITLRLNGSPLSYTTLPVEEGAVLGKPMAALLDQTRSPITATTNTTVNVTLPAGFKISGQVTGSLAVLNKVVARSGQDQFSANIDIPNSRYVVVVPAGTYQLSVCYLAASQIPPGVPILRHNVAPDVVVNADVVRDITIPSVDLRTVSGTVSGLNQFPTNSTAALSFVTGDEDSGVTEQLLPGGAYTAFLPNGTYTASLLLEPPGGQQSILSLFNIGNLTVNGPTTANFAAPAAVTLSGAVTRADATGMPPGSFLTVVDTTLPASAMDSGCVNHANASSGELATANGAYQLLVPRDRALRASVVYPLGAIGSILFPAGGRDLPALTANRTEDFNIPAIPPLDVTISGRVTDGGGQGVAEVRVGAFSDQLTGVAGQLSFSGQTQTDGNGNYTMNVPAGSNYQLTFVPRRPAP